MATPSAPPPPPPKPVNAADLAGHLKKFCEGYHFDGHAKPLFGREQGGVVNRGDGVGYRGYRFLNNLVFGLMLDEYGAKPGIDTKTLLEYNRQSLAEYIVDASQHNELPDDVAVFNKVSAIKATDDLISKLRAEIKKVKENAVTPASVGDRGFYQGDKAHLDSADPTATVAADSAHYDQAIEALSGRAV